MKKLSLILALALLATFSGCANPDHHVGIALPDDRPPEASASESGDSSEAKTPDTYVSWSDDSLCAIRYLGYDYGAKSPKELEEWATLTEEYPFLDELAENYYANIGGGEFYLIIPRDPKSDVFVYGMEFRETVEITGCLYVSRGAFIINCNLSDIYSNAKTVINVNDQLCEFSQWISLKDGSVSTDNPNVQIIGPSRPNVDAQ